MTVPQPARPEVALHPFRPARALIVVILALLLGLLSDWLRTERVLFLRPLPQITTEPAP